MPETLYKEELVRRVQPSFLGMADTWLVVNAVLNVIQNHLQTPGNRVVIRGFGVLQSWVQQPHVGRNPKRGVQVRVARKRRVSFKPSVSFFNPTEKENVSA